ncbi:MAG: ABC transporter ATP-binding protein [Nitrospinae bacterium]|nr:ABC transporter ATP-binding protein [Nitrospinota bacterium]
MYRCETAPDGCKCERPVIEVKDLSFTRDGKIILEKLNFCVDRGLFVGLIGPNGGGKTTFLQMLLGKLKPTSGEIKILGEPPVLKQGLVGFVPQRNVIDWTFPVNCLEVVLMGAYGKLGIFKQVTQEIKNRALKLLEKIGALDYAYTPIGELSGGQQQRIFICRALISKPEIILLDEPTTGLDSHGQNSFLEFIKMVQQEFKLTAIMVSHDISQLQNHADQIACLNKKMHWHNKAELINEKVIADVYSCELDKFFIDHKDHLESFHADTHVH